MPGNAFVEAIFAEYAEGGGKPALKVGALLVRVVELWRSWEYELLASGLGLAETRFKRGFGRAVLAIGQSLLVVSCLWRRHFFKDGDAGTDDGQSSVKIICDDVGMYSNSKLWRL